MKTNITPPSGELRRHKRPTPLLPIRLALGALALAGLVATGHAQTTYVKANNNTALNSTNSYLVGGVTPTTLPGSADTIQIDRTLTGSQYPVIGDNLSVNAINQVASAKSQFGCSATSGKTLTIGVGGITMGGGAILQVNCALALGANQTWNIAPTNSSYLLLACTSFVDNGYTLTVNATRVDLNGTGVTFGPNVTFNGNQVSVTSATADDILAGVNTFTNLLVNSGTIEGSSFPTSTNAGTTSNFGTGNGGTVTLGGGSSSGTLIYRGNTAATPKSFTMDARNSGSCTIKVSTSGQTLSLTNLLYNQSQTANVNWNFGGAGNLAIWGVIANRTAGFKIGVNKNDAGTLTLGAANTYTGDTFVNGGTLALTGSGSISSSTNIVLGAGTTFDVSGKSSTFALQSFQTISNSSASGVTLVGNINASSGAFWGSFKSGVIPFTLQSGTLTLSAGTVFNLNSLDPRLPVGGVYAIIKGGGTVAGTAPYSGSGSLSLSGGAITAHLVINSGELDLVVDSATLAGAEPLHWAGSGTGTWDVADTGNTIWKDNTTPTALTTYYVDGDTAQFDEQHISANQTVTLDSTVSPSSVLVSNANYSYTISGSGAIGGTAVLTKDGTGTLTLATANTYTGGTIISNGTVQMGNANALGANGAKVTVNSGAVLDVNGTFMLGLNTNLLTLNGSGPAGGGALINGANTVATYYGAITLGSASTIGSTHKNLNLISPITGNYPLTLDSGLYTGAAIVPQGTISGANLSLVMIGNVQLYVQANSYGGGTYLEAGQTSAYNKASFGTGPIYVGYGGGGGTVALAPSVQTSTWTNPIIVMPSSNGPSLFHNNWKQGTTWAGPVTLSNNLQIASSQNGTGTPGLTISGPIGGPGGVIIGRPGAYPITDPVYFSTNNTYTGATYVSYANLNLTGSGSISNSSLISVMGGQTFDVSGLSSQPSPYTLRPGQVLANSLNGSQSAALNGNMAGGSGTLLLTYDGSDNCFNASDLLVSSQTLVVVNPAATLTAGNTYTLASGLDGASTLPTLQMLRGAGTLQIVGTTLQLTVTSTATPGFNEPLHWAGTGAGVWQPFTPTNLWKDSSAPAKYTGYSDLDTVQFDEQYISADQVVTLNGVVSPPSIVVSNTHSYTLTGPGAIAGTGTLTKTGSGTFTLATGGGNGNNNSFSGATTVSNGTLMLNCTIVSPVTVNGGVLSGTYGTISNSVTVNSGGTLAPTPWLYISGDLTLNPGSTTAVAVTGGAGAVNQIIMQNKSDGSQGTATYGGILSITPTGTFQIGQSYTLFQGAGAANASNFASITGSPGAGMAFAFTNGVLSVVAGQTQPNPTNITYTVTGPTSMTLNWPSGQGWNLQSNSVSLVNTSAWQTVTGATPPYPVTINPSQPAVFYRLKY